MSEPLVVHPGSTGLDPAALVPGRALVVAVDPAHGLALPRGAALEDHLDPAAGASVDAEARERLAAWRARRSAAFTVDGLDLSWVWEVELLAGCFLPAIRLLRGLERLGVAGRRIEFAGAVPGHAAIAELLGATAVTLPRRSRPPAPERPVGAVARLLAQAGVPRRLRGDVVVFPYWHMGALLERMAADPAWRPAASGVVLSRLPAREALGVAWRGGWLGHAGGRAHRRAEADLARALDSRAPDPAADPLDAALDDQAAELLRTRAAQTVAEAHHFRDALARHRLRALLLPFDSPASVRALIEPARAAGIPSVVVQHGYDAGLGDPDKTEADLVCAWSEHDVADLAGRARGDVRLTGNPGAEDIAPRPAVSGGPAVVLVEYPGRLSARVGDRIRLEHVRTALEALPADAEVVVRPHPSDLTVDAYEALARNVTVASGGPIEPLLERAGVVVGALSTATLQAAALGVPTVHLNVTGAAQPWPFDGSAIPVATDAASLGEALGAARGGEAADTAREALGVRPGAVEAVLGAMDDYLH